MADLFYPAVLIELLLITTAVMTGVIWVVQIYIYPNFQNISPSQWIEFHKFHTKMISFIVIPLMLTEGLFTCLLIGSIFNIPLFQWILLMTIIAWASTFIIQVPIHLKLSNSHQPILIKRIIHTNWIRTVAWTAKFFLLININ